MIGLASQAPPERFNSWVLGHSGHEVVAVLSRGVGANGCGDCHGADLRTVRGASVGEWAQSRPGYGWAGCRQWRADSASHDLDTGSVGVHGIGK